MGYLEFYKLKEYPFSNAVDNRFYYNSTQHAEAIVRVKYAIDTRKGLAIAIGDIGTGKTTVARRLLDELDETRYEAALLVVLHSSVTSDWLMKKIAMQLGVEHPSNSKLELIGQIYKKLIEIYEKGLKTVVIIDEAQMLQSREIMEEFRGLLNMEISGGKLITFIFFGLPQLEDALSLDKPLKQRVAVRYTLKAFKESVTHDYIHHRLKVAGCENNIFTFDAINSVHLFSKGVPRLINSICDNALLEAFLQKKEMIDNSIIESVVIDLGLKQIP